MSINDIPKILVVNDDPASLFVLTDLVSEWAHANDCEVIAARSGEEALRNVLTHDFAVILLDVDMPGMDGFETAEAIHSRPRSASIPIIFVTAFLADEMNRLKGYQQGAVDYLFTPIIPQILQAKIAVFVALARKNLQLTIQTEELHHRTAELLSINKRLELEIRQRKLAVQQSKAKDEFLAMLGHELRNPLNAISSAASILGFPGVNTDTADRAKGILQRQIQHLTRIIDDLLDLSRVMSGKILLARQPLEISRVVETCIETLKATGRTNPYTVEVHTESAWINADPTRIEQIISNLLDNALKYTPSGGKIEVEAQPEEDSVILIVRDSGVGISPDLLPHIFDVFVQGESTLDRSQGGLGIGLALVHQLVALHGGTISANSSGTGSGSVFMIRLPRTTGVATKELPASSPVPQKAHCVLLIEDNKDGREMMSAILLAYGNRVLQAADGKAGLLIAATEKPDIALIDIGLPGINGYDVARHLRNDPATHGIRLIALTGYGLEADQRQAMEAGFDMHLVKPVDADHLLAAIGTLPEPREEEQGK